MPLLKKLTQLFTKNQQHAPTFSVSQPTTPPDEISTPATSFTCNLCAREVNEPPIALTTPDDNGGDVTREYCGVCHDTMGAVTFHKFSGYHGRSSS